MPQTEQQRQATFQAAGVPQPAAQTPVTPVPQQNTPPAPAPYTNPNANMQVPQGTPPIQVNVGTAPQGTPATQQNQPTSKPLTMPASGSVVDLLNAAGQDSSFAARQKLAQQYGMQGYTGTASQNKDLSKKYLDAYNANKALPVPQSSADASKALDTYFKDTAQEPQQDPQKSFFDEYMAMNPVIKTMYDAINHELSAPTTFTSFKDEFAKLQQEQGIPALNTELMNIKNIMDGTEDDIRTEISKAGGFATESQVQALTYARNKTLLKQANVLQQQLAIKNDYVDQLMQFSEKDRAQVDKEVERKLGLTEKLTKIQESMTNAAKDNYKTLVDKVGFAGLSQAFGGDAKGMAQAERSLGLPSGTLANEAFLEMEKKKEAKPLQFVSGTEHQASGVFNPNTGVFTSRGGGGTAGGTGVSTSVVSNPAVQQALTTILGSGTFTKQQQANVVNAIQNGQDPFTVIKNQAKNVMGQTLATNLSNNEKARAALIDLDSALKSYYANGGKTNIFSGNYEEAVGKIGEVNDPKLRELATQIEASLQIYRNAVSGTAYSVQEGKAIAAIFPGINKTSGLNQAIIKGRMRAFESVVDESYGQVLGQDTYQQLKQMEQRKQQASAAKGTQSNAEFIAKAVNNSGRSYDKLISGAPKGQIAVADNATGQIGYIPAEDFNNNTYTRL